MSEYDPQGPHTPTASERLSLLYRTGDESGSTAPDNGEAFSGLVKVKGSARRNTPPDVAHLTAHFLAPCGVAEGEE